MTTGQTEINARLHRTGDYVAEYRTRVLRPAEVVILARYREALSGRVLEVGPGGGRILGYLVALGGEVHGIDVSQRMVDYCRATYPEAHVRVADVRDLTPQADGRFDAIIAGYNVIDVFDDATRKRVLGVFGQLLTPAGLAIFSSHNRAHVEDRAGAPAGRARPRDVLSMLDRPPSFYAHAPARLAERVRNQRRLRPLQRREPEYAIVNDMAYNYGSLHYYIRQADQRRQLEELGFEVIECLDLEGRTVAPDEPGEGPELHYVARRA